MAKQLANITSLGQVQADTVNSYLSAPMISVPSGTVLDSSGNVRQIHDPSKTLRLAIGVERVHFKVIKYAFDERVTSGDPVWKLDNDEERVRFVGNWSQATDSTGTAPVGNNSTDYFEITFYGTGLNVLSYAPNDARNWAASVDGGANGSNIFFGSTSSAILGARNYSPNQILAVTSGLTLGTHTVKISNVGSVAARFLGFEVLNESSSINVPMGEIVSDGHKEVISAATTTAYNSGFDGSPTLNGRGGHVVVYSKNGKIGKVIQQTNATQANFPSATHANEQLIRRINWREFGYARADDFSTLGTAASARAFTLDDGVTTLICTSALYNAASGGLAISGVNSLTLTFVGTGLDIYMTNPGAGTIDTVNVSVDGGSSFGPITAAGNTSGGLGYQKIVSGLPFGTHTVKFSDSGGGTFEWVIWDILLYGPSKPSIPDGAIEVDSYYLMPDFAAQNATGSNAISSGIIRKANTREMIYVGTWTATLNAANINGWVLSTTTTGDYIQYTFWGTGIDFRFASTATSTTFQFNVDGSINVSGFTTSSFGTGITSFTASTGTVVTSTTAVSGNRVSISGLTLGKHTVKISKTAGTGAFDPEAFDLITPVYFPDVHIGSLSSAKPVSFPNKNISGNVDMGKAKAWINYDMAGNAIQSSYNIAGALTAATGRCYIWFERPFKNDTWVFVNGGQTSGDESVNVSLQTLVSGNYVKNPFGALFNVDNEAGTNVSRIITLAFFGELIDEGDDE